MNFPKMLRLRQKFPKHPPVDIAGTLAQPVKERPLLRGIQPGARIAVCTGSRGITNIAAFVKAVVGILKEAGAAPFIIPAMGSHGGANARGPARQFSPTTASAKRAPASKF